MPADSQILAFALTLVFQAENLTQALLCNTADTRVGLIQTDIFKIIEITENTDFAEFGNTG